MKTFLVSAILVFSGVQAHAQSGADVLLDELSGGKSTLPADQVGNAAAAGSTQVPGRTRPTVNLNDPFLRQLYSQVETHGNLSFDVRNWADFIFSGEYAKAGHLWTTLQPQMPDDFKTTAQAAQLYILWKLGLNQTFFDQWVKSLADSNYAQALSELALEAEVSPGLDQWLIQNAIYITPEQDGILAKLNPDKLFLANLKAWSSLRQPEKAEPLLAKLPPENKIRPLLAQTAALIHVQKNDLKGAARILKAYMEPSIEMSHDVVALARHDINIARILYQAGQMGAAAEFYQKIPNTSPYFMEAREELAWVYLRKGDVAKLRGELSSLSSPLFKDQFAPEVFLVRAISDLKMCYYESVEKDFKNFNSLNGVWAKKIDQALASQDPPVPSRPDAFTQMSSKAVSNLDAERRKLSDLGDQSIGATLPAVGKQKHWKDYQAQVESTLALAQKRQTDEYRRQWKNQNIQVSEAIRKMRFVKVEYLTQIRELGKQASITKGSLVADNGPVPASVAIKGEDVSNKLTFPVNDDLWPDELFKQRSAAQAQCLKGGGNK